MSTNDPIEPLRQIVAELEADPGDPRRSPRWNQVLNLLRRTDAPEKSVVNIVAGRNLDGLKRLVTELEAPAPTESGEAVDPHEMKMAMRAFRERLKLVRLDHESKLGRSPLTGGKSAEIDAILPPREYSKEVWDALVREDKLRNAGGGFYELAE